MRLSSPTRRGQGAIVCRPPQATGSPSDTATTKTPVGGTSSLASFSVSPDGSKPKRRPISAKYRPTTSLATGRGRVDRLERHRRRPDQQVGLAQGPDEALPLALRSSGSTISRAWSSERRSSSVQRSRPGSGQRDLAAAAVAGVGADADEAVRLQAAQQAAEVAGVEAEALAQRLRGQGGLRGRGAAPISNSRRAGPSGIPRPRKESSRTPMRWV